MRGKERRALGTLSRLRAPIGWMLVLAMLLAPAAAGRADGGTSGTPSAGSGGTSGTAAAPSAGNGGARLQSSAQSAEGARADPTAGLSAGTGTESDPYYRDKLAEWVEAGASADHDGKLSVPASAFARTSERADVRVDTIDGRAGALDWNAAGDDWIEYDVDVARSGLYRIELTYRPVTDGKHRRPIMLNVKVDGKTDYLEARSIQLDRRWHDPFPAALDPNGDQIRPMAEDISGWMTAELRDSGGAYTVPLLWYLPAGRHTLRFAANEPVALETIALSAPERVPDYAAVKSGYGQFPAADAKASAGTGGSADAEPIVIEAEQADWKSDSSVSLRYDNDIATTPNKRGRITYNTVDGKRWASGNQQLSWTFEVPESGYYKIGMRVKQSYSSNRSTFRTILVNGRVPFAELEAYRFPYASGWQGIRLEDGAQEPYLFYLEKGKNTISMRSTISPVQPMIIELEANVDRLMKLTDDLKALTGGSSDPNRTWNLDRELPGFVDDLGQVAASLDDIRSRLEEVNGRKDAITQGLVTTVNDIRSLLAYANDIPYKTDRFVTMQGRVADLLQQLKSQPLQLDRIYVVPEDRPFPSMVAPFFKRVEGALVNFLYSFRSKERLSDIDDDVLNVWVLRGRDYVNLLQQLSDEMFTPETGIRVKVNLLPDTNLLVLMLAAGMAPDVALGLPQELPFDYAIRNGLYDLTKFADFDELYRRFAPGSWTPFYYEKGYYAVPETQSFSMLYYRKDILDQLGLQVPDTWQDVYDMLPVLQQHHYNMMPTQHMPFFFQNGADYYTKDGLHTALGTEKGYRAFKEWTDLYNVYAVDQQVASFYQSFRSGTVPIGIADFSMYVQLMVAAPELNGYWGIAPIPGVRQPDGTVARWMGGGLQASVMFRQTKKPEAAWSFLKWWTSAEVQERYGMDLETLNGLSFRWNTSNIEAFVHLPWKEDDLRSILEQWRWFKEIPNVPGGYFLERELQNAWNRTVVDGVNYRSSLESSIAEIEREMQRKLVEFGHIDANGGVLRTLDLPDVSKPWEGVDPYVRN